MLSAVKASYSEAGLWVLRLSWHENDLLGLRKMDIAKLLENLRVVDGRASLGDLDVSPTLEWCD
jgi:hypothetical protein